MSMIPYVVHRIGVWLRREDGQGLVEYALILVLIAIVASVILALVGGQVSRVLSTVGNSLGACPPPKFIYNGECTTG